MTVSSAWHSWVHDSHDWITLRLPFAREAMIAADFDFPIWDPHLDFRFRDPHLDFRFPESFRFTIICVAMAILSWPSLRLSISSSSQPAPQVKNLEFSNFFPIQISSWIPKRLWEIHFSMRNETCFGLLRAFCEQYLDHWLPLFRTFSWHSFAAFLPNFWLFPSPTVQHCCKNTSLPVLQVWWTLDNF